MRLFAPLIISLAGALPVSAAAPASSLPPLARGEVPLAEVAQPVRPQARPAVPAATRASEASGATAAAIAAARVRPVARKPSEQEMADAARPATMAFLAPGSSYRPFARPKGIETKALAKRTARRKGAVCGDLAIQGEEVGNVKGKIKACGIRDAVRVTSVSGVRLSTGALMNCKTAHALKTWVDNGLKPAFRRRGPVVEMKVAAHYACRNRNNRKGGRISEHGKGNAIDLSAFTMMDGEVVTVLHGWGRGTTLKPLRNAHRAACGPFGTVLGPNADRHHRDHFHFDTASHRSGSYCR